MRTAQEIINHAYARQARAQQGADADEAGELLPILQQNLETYFQAGARQNPDYFSVERQVYWDATRGGWLRPRNAEIVHHVRDEVGEIVARVPFDDQGAEPSEKSVYRLGGVYKPALLAEDHPRETSVLTFVYAKRPDTIGDLNSEIDEMWPHGHEMLLALEIAIYIAQKDAREADATFLIMQRDREQIRFITFLEHEDIGVSRRKSLARSYTSAPVAGG